MNFFYLHVEISFWQNCSQRFFHSLHSWIGLFQPAFQGNSRISYSWFRCAANLSDFNHPFHQSIYLHRPHINRLQCQCLSHTYCLNCQFICYWPATNNFNTYRNYIESSNVIARFLIKMLRQ